MATKQITSATLEAIAECKNMTELLKQDLAKYESQKLYNQKLTNEWQRLKTIYNSSKSIYDARCSGNCRTGGVQQYGCDPLCRNWSILNVEPIKPPDVPLPYPGTYVCTICNQAIDISNIAGGDVNILKNAINQQMTCTSALEKQLSDMPDEDETTIIPPAGKAQTNIDSAKMFIIGAILIILIVVGILIAWVIMDESDESDGSNPVQ